MRGYCDTDKLKNEAIIVSRPSGHQAQLRIAGSGSWFGEERGTAAEAQLDLTALRAKHCPTMSVGDGISPATRAAMDDALRGQHAQGSL